MKHVLAIAIVGGGSVSLMATAALFDVPVKAAAILGFQAVFLLSGAFMGGRAV